MDKKYIELFRDLSQSAASSAETVMEYDRQQGDEQGLKTATMMRDDFQALHDRIDLENYQITKDDAAKLLVSAMMISNQLQDKVNTLKKAITGYKTDIIPKLQDIVDNASNDEEAQKIADEKFIIKNDK